MLRAPRVDTRQTAQPFMLPAPTGGLNGRDSLAAMPSLDAYFMDNWFPGTSSCVSRNGFTTFATGLGASVEAVEAYVGGATSKLLGFAGGKIFDCSAGGAVGAPLQSGRVGNDVVTTMFSNAGSQFLMGASGKDVIFSYDGTTVTNMAITGVTGSAATLQTVFSFKGRLYFTQLNQLGFYYLPVGQIQGAAAYFDLAQVARRGGHLLAVTSFSMDSAGVGPNDYFLAITSEGEYIVYAGNDPSNAANFTLVGRYYSAPPIGRRCYVEYNSDVLIITTEGMIPFSNIRTDEGADPTDSITYRLGSLLTDYAALYQTTPGWKALVYSKAGYLLLNVPTGTGIGSKYIQYVMNTKTKKWTRFVGQNSLCWALFKQSLYFGDAIGNIFIADSGGTDNGTPIQLDCKQAYSLFDNGRGSGFANKHFHFANLLVSSDGRPPLSAKFNVDYVENQPSYATQTGVGTDSLWDVSSWDVTDWGQEGTTFSVLIALGYFGQAGSLWLRASVSEVSLEWFATKYIFSVAAGLI
jgi:hypothetical protein